MIMPQKMKDAVDHEHLKLLGERDAAFQGLPFCQWQGDEDITKIGQSIRGIAASIREGKHVCGFVDAGIAAIELSNGILIGKNHRKSTLGGVFVLEGCPGGPHDRGT